MSIQSERRRLRESLDPGRDLPATEFVEAAPRLAQTFLTEEVMFRAWDCWPDEAPTHASIVPYVDARVVQGRLDRVCPHLWSRAFRYENGAMWCDLTIDGITRPDVGGNNVGKGLVSDAFQRAAMAFGVGAFLWRVPPIELNASDHPDYLRPWRIDGRPALALTPAGLEFCRGIYRRWLLAKGGGIEFFGPPIGSGDLRAGSETPITGAPRPKPDREQAPTPQRRTPPKRQNRGEQVVGAVEPEAVDPEVIALAELDAKLNATDGLADERKAINSLMTDICLKAGTVATAVYRLGEIEQAELDRDGPLEGLRKKVAALSSIALMPKVKEEASET